MQLQGLMLILFMSIAIPVMILFANHNLFYILMAIILLIISIRSIHNLLFKGSQEKQDSNDELLSELEDLIDIDIKKFGVGTKVVKHLTAILFFIYCDFYTNLVYVKFLIALIILYWLTGIFCAIFKNVFTDRWKAKWLKEAFVMFINISTIALIMLVTCNKFIRGII